MPDPSDTNEHVSPSGTERDGGRGNLPLAAVLVVALVALGLAGWALLRPTPNLGLAGEASYTDAQRADAKTKICATFDQVRQGVSQNTNLQAPGGPADLAGSMAVAANARLSLYEGGQYLLARLDPATPSALADPVRSFANNLMDIGAAATAGALNTEAAQAARLHDADALNVTIAGLCR